MKFKLLIVFTFILLIINFHLVSLLIKNEVFLSSAKVDALWIELTKDENQNTKKEMNKNFFPDFIELKDYSTVKYTLENEWKELIKTIRELHKTPSLIDIAYRDKDLCAGFLWSLSEEIWWEYIPYYIWMMTVDTKVPANSWELPSSYSSFWGEVLIDFSEKINLETFKEDYRKSLTKNDLLKFFSLTFWEKALLWDIWFLYKDTQYLDSLLDIGYYNSHIVKNMWISEFIKQINFGWNFDNHELVFHKLFNSDIKEIDKLEYVLSSYKFYLNWIEMTYNNWEFFYIDEWNYIWDRVEFKVLDNISYSDITVAHYYDWKWRVDSLLNLVLSWDFLPINIMTINSRFIEKM